MTETKIVIIFLEPQTMLKFKISLNILLLLVFSNLLYAQESKSAAQNQFNVASGAFADKFYQASASLFEKFINDFPGHQLTPKAELYLAKCHYYRQNYSQGLILLKKLENKNYPELNNQVYYWLAKIFFENNDFEGAIDYASKVSGKEEEAEVLKAGYLKALSYLKLKNVRKAKEIFENLSAQTINQQIADNSYENLLKLLREERNFPEIISSAPDYLSKQTETTLKDTIYFYLADSYREKKQFKNALKYYDLALSENPGPQLSDLIYQGLSLAYLGEKNTDLAKKAIDKIIDSQLRLFTEGLYCYKDNQFVLALDLLAQYIQTYPLGKYSARAYLIQADILYEMGRINDAASFYQKILEKFTALEQPEIINLATYGLAWCYLKMGDFKKAILEFRNALKHSDDPIVKISSKIQIADAYLESEKFQEALDIYNRLLQEHPHSFYGDYIQFQIAMIFTKEEIVDKAILALNNLLQNFPRSRLIPEANYYKAINYFSVQQYRQAQAILESLLADYPGSRIETKAKYLQAKTLFNQQQYQQAIKILKAIIASGRETAIVQLAYIDAGLAYLNLGESGQTKHVYREFLTKYPDSEYSSLIALNIGKINEKEGNYREAEKHYLKSIELAKSIREKQNGWLALGHLFWSQNDLAQAAGYFQKASQGQTTLSLKSKLHLARIHQEKGNPEIALQIYEDLADSETNIADAALINKAFLLMDLEDYGQAIAIFSQAASRGITSPEIEFSLAICFEQSGLYQKALDTYFSLIYTYPDQINYQTRAYFRIADIYQKQNDLNQAKNAYKKIISLKIPESKIAAERLKKIKN